MSARFIFSFLSVLTTTAVLAAARPHWTTDAPASYSSHTVVATKTTTVGVTTIVSATTVVPVTTVFPVTTVVPVTTVIPVTSVVPITSSVPVTVTTTTTVAPVPVTTTVVVTSPPATTTVGGTPDQCSTGPVQCCKFVRSATSSKASALLGLLGIVLSSLDVPVGMDCSPLNVLGSGPSCSAQAVCCQNNNFNGLVAIGCTPININL